MQRTHMPSFRDQPAADASADPSCGAEDKRNGFGNKGGGGGLAYVGDSHWKLLRSDELEYPALCYYMKLVETLWYLFKNE
jgi:hypothetical protein